MEQAWDRRAKTSPAIDELFKLLIEVVHLVKEDYYIGLTPCLYRVVGLLKDPNSTEHHDELINLLSYLIEMEKNLSFEVIEVLVSLDQLIKIYRGKIHLLLPIFNCLNCASVANEVLYSHSDLIMLVSRYYCDYFLNVVDDHHL